MEPTTETACPPEYEITKYFGFGVALKALEDGKRVKREGWKNALFVYLVPGSTFIVNRPPLLGIYAEGTVIDYRPHIDVRNTDGTCSTWAPSNGDALARDWMLAE